MDNALYNFFILGELKKMKDTKKTKEQLITELAESEEKYRIQVEMATDAIFLETVEGRILECNAAGAKMFGYTKEKMVGLTIADLVPKDFVKTLPKIITEKDTTYGKFVSRISKKKDGTIFPTEIATKLINIGGKPRLIAYIRDITERKRAEKKRKSLLKKEREQHLKAETLAKVALILTSKLSLSDVLGKILRQVKRLVPYYACNIVLIEKGEVFSVHSFGYDKYGSKKFVDNFFYPLDKLSLEKEVIKSAKSQLISDTHQDPRWIIFKETSWIRSRLSMPVCLGNKVIGLLNLDDDAPGKFVKDDIKKLQPLVNAAAIALENTRLFEEVRKEITERKQAEKALVESEEKYRTVFENTGTATVIIEEDKTISMANTQSEKLTGYSKDEIENKIKWTDFIIPEDLKMMEKYHRERRKAGGKVPPEYEFRLIDKKGNIKNTFLKVGMIPGTKKSIASLIDITERKQAEVKLQEREKRFRGLFNNTSNGVVIYEAKNNGQDFIIRDFNRAAEKIEKAKNEDIIGKSVLKVFPGVKDFGLLKVFQEVYKTGRPQHHPISLYKDQRITGWRENHVYKLPSGEIVAVYDDITERKKAEEELKNSEERLKILFDYAPDAYYINDIKGKIIDGNKAAERLIGYKKEELIGKSFLKLKLVSLADMPKAAKLLVNNLRVQTTGPDELVLNRKDNSKVTVEISTYPVKIKGRTLVLSIARDITKRKRAESELRIERDKLTAIFESMADGVYIVNKNYDIQYVNPVLKRTFGSPEGKKCHEYFHDSDEPCTFCKNKDVFAGKTVHWEWASPKDGKTYDLIDTPIKNADGSISKLEIFRDITERKQAEEALRQSEEKYRGIFDESIAAIYLFDAQKNFIDSNQAGLDLLGYPRKELLKMSIPDVDADTEAVLPAHKKLLAGDRIVNYEHQLKRKDGSIITVLNNSRPLIDIDGNVVGMQSTLIDITERKQAEENVKKAKDELQMIMDSVPALIIYKDTEGKIIRANKTLADRLEIPVKDMVGKAIEELFPKEQAENMRKDDKEVIISGKPKRDIIQPYTTPDGTRWTITDKMPYKDKEGKIIGVIAFAKDITVQPSRPCLG
jgi:PAS domain S-box-containing protein